MPNTAQFIVDRLTEWGVKPHASQALPPHVTLAKAAKIARTLPGDPHAGRFIKGSLKGNVEEFITR